MTVPDSWDKVAFGQFLRIQPGMPVATILAILWDKTLDEVNSMRFDVGEVLKTLAFLDEPVPQVSRETNLETVTVDRYEDLKYLMTDLKGTADDFAKYPAIYATFEQAVYDEKTVDQWIPIAEKLPCGQVLGSVIHYMREVERIEDKWGKLFPKSGYSAEQIAAGYKQVDEYFKFYGTLMFMESSLPFKREELLKWTVADFKYNLLYLAWKGEAAKKYSEGQAAKVREKTKR